MNSQTSIEASFREKAARFRALVPVMVAICVIGTGNSLLTTSVSLSLSLPGIDPGVVQLLLTGFPVGFLPAAWQRAFWSPAPVTAVPFCWSASSPLSPALVTAGCEALDWMGDRRAAQAATSGRCRNWTGSLAAISRSVSASRRFQIFPSTAE
jgi:hypothetical protein